MKKNEDTPLLTSIRMSKEIFRKLKKVCVLKDETCQGTVERLVESYCKKEAKKLGLDLERTA